MHSWRLRGGRGPQPPSTSKVRRCRGARLDNAARRVSLAESICGVIHAKLRDLQERPADAPPPLRHHRPAVRERLVPHRAHHGVHPGRHLGAVPADAGARGAFRLRRRCARRADHAQGRGRGDHPAGAGRPDRRRAPALPRGLPHLLRQLALDRLAGERRAVAGHLPAAQGRRARLHPHDRAALRPGEGDVPRRPLHQGRVPGLRRERPVRRRLRTAAASTRRPT